MRQLELHVIHSLSRWDHFDHLTPFAVYCPQSATISTHHNPYSGLNTVMAAAYDAAYAAALVVAQTAAGQADNLTSPATNPQHQQLVQMNGQTYALVPLHTYQQAAATASGTSHPFAFPGQLGGHTFHPSMLSASFGAEGASSSSSATANLPGQPGTAGDVGAGSGAVPADAAQAMRFLQADLAAQLAVLARRSARVRLHPRRGERPLLGGAEAAAAQQNAMQADAAGVPRGMLGREVRRVFLLRIPLTTRSLLQLLVFAVVLYQVGGGWYEQQMFGLQDGAHMCARVFVNKETSTICTS